MLIVPDNDDLIVEAKVDPKDIDQIKMDQLAELRFSAFNQRTTPAVLGHVTRIAADVIQDPHSGSNYYVIRVGIEPDEIKKLKQLQLVPGMPVEVFVQTEPQTMLSYLMKPLKDQFARTFREG